MSTFFSYDIDLLRSVFHLSCRNFSHSLVSPVFLKNWELGLESQVDLDKAFLARMFYNDVMYLASHHIWKPLKCGWLTISGVELFDPSIVKKHL